MRLTYTAPIWAAISSYAEKDIAKQAGLRWNPTTKRWETREAGIARKLLAYADEAATLALSAAMMTQHETAMDPGLQAPCPDEPATGRHYMWYQIVSPENNIVQEPRRILAANDQEALRRIARKETFLLAPLPGERTPSRVELLGRRGLKSGDR